MDKPLAKRIRRDFNVVRPDPDLLDRQMAATRQAFIAFASVDEARRFLNEPDAHLGGRPLDLAGGSAEGLARVLGVIAAGGPQANDA